MPRAASVKQYNTFVKGLITEASPITYPENASLDEDNFVLKRNGSRERRLGLDYETSYTLTSTGLASTIVEGTRCSFHKWENPGGSTNVSIGVVRVYNKFWFLNLLTSNPSANLLNGGSAISLSGLTNSEIESIVVNNTFVLVSKELAFPTAFVYNSETDTVTAVNIPIQIRDLFGVVDGLSETLRPSTLSKTHEYNLINQGWDPSIQTVCGSDINSKVSAFWSQTGLTPTPAVPETSEDPLVTIAYWQNIFDASTAAEDPALGIEAEVPTYTSNNAIECTKTTIGVYPSNSDSWALGKVGDSTSSNFEKYSPNVMVRNSIDGVAVAKGHFILDAFDRGYSRRTLLGNNSLPLDRENGRPSTIASYAGRAFYSGIESSITMGDGRSPNYSNYIFFSQIVTDSSKLGKCYQEADPTSPNISDIIDTDGGVIQIPEATRIIKLIATKMSLLVFAENGIWEIFGDTNGFVATSYQSSKISSTGCSSPKSVVSALDTVFAWTRSGIYVLAADQTTDRYKAENISLLTIQSIYNGFSDLAKSNARGFYDEKENTIRWLYNNSVSYSASSFVNRYDSELVLDLTLQAFYPQSFPATTPYIADYIDIPSYTVSEVAETVYVNDDVVLSSTDEVVANIDTVSNRLSQFSFLTMVGTSFTVSKYNSRTFLDWYTYDLIGVDYSSYLVTGYELFGDSLRNKQVPYIWFYFTKTEDGFDLDGNGNLQLASPSSCLVKAKWNWTDSAASGQWGTQFQVYKFKRNYIPSGAEDTFDNGYEVIITKNKLRGYGRSLSLLIESESGKDMKLLGWAVMVNAEGTP